MDQRSDDLIGHLVIDLSSFVWRFYDNPFIRSIAMRFSLHELITFVLCFNQYQQQHEAIWFELEKRYGDKIDEVDHQVFEINYEAFMLDLDNFIRMKSPNHIDTGQFVIHEWIGHNTILMRYDETSELHRSSWQAQHCEPHGFSYSEYTRILGRFSRRPF